MMIDIRTTLTYHAAARKNIAEILEQYSLAQLNKVPQGFNNNLIWNAAHVIATCELLTYGLAGHHTPSGGAFINRYRKGTKPEGNVTQEEADHILAELTTGHERLVVDLAAADWSDYKSYTTSFGVEMTSIDEGLTFNNMHEAMHLGTMLGLRKLV